MKKTLKGYLLGFLSATLLVGCVTAFAANTTTLYDVIANGVKIVVDGQKLNPTDVNGNKVEPIIYNGTTYLPVRAVANAFGKAVYWDGPNYTVYLGDMNGKLEYPTVELRDMENIGGGFDESDDLIDNYDSQYKNGVKANWRMGLGYNLSNTEYLLNMKYSSFKGTLYVPKGITESGELGYLEIKADGKTIFTSDILTKISRPIDIEVDITGCNYLTITFKGEECGCIRLGNAGFYQ